MNRVLRIGIWLLLAFLALAPLRVRAFCDAGTGASALSRDSGCLGPRYFDPEVGQYISRDPTGYGDGMNVYVYVHDNPINHIDPLGLRNETFGFDNWFWELIIPDPVGNYRAGSAQSQKLFDSNSSGLERTGGALGSVGFAIQTAIEFVPGEELLEKGVEKGLTKLAGKEGEHLVENAAKNEAVHLAEQGGKKAVGEEIEKGGQKVLQEGSGESVKDGAQGAKDLSKENKTYQTYTKTNPDTGKVYSGRTSGTGTPEENIKARDSASAHHMNDQGFGPAQLDKSSSNPDAIRGREQQLIEANGGAKSQGGTSGNKINGVSPTNEKGSIYRNAAQQEFGQ